MDKLENKLTKKIVYKGYIKALTGLHIGSTNATMQIGGADKLVIRNPLSGLPYIPGSSLKGKLRSLIEIKTGDVTPNPDKKMGTVYLASEDPKAKSSKLFGTSSSVKGGHPSRLIVRDCELALCADETYGIKEENIPNFSNTDMPYTETKTETSVCRVTAATNPRTFERVPAGAIFKLDMVLNVFEKENDNGELESILNDALELLKNDYLGGQGSRGYGQVEIWLPENPQIIEYVDKEENN